MLLSPRFMIVTCPACRAEHNVAVIAIPHQGVEMACRRCRRLFLASRLVASEAAAPLVDGSGEAATVRVACSSAEPDAGEVAVGDANEHEEDASRRGSQNRTSLDSGPHRYYAEFAAEAWDSESARPEDPARVMSESSLPRRLADRLNAAGPWARLGWVLVPTALGVALLFGARDPGLSALRSDAELSGHDGEVPGSESQDLGVLDVEATPGYFFVQVGDGAVRGMPDDGSPPLARLENGRLVRELWREGAWSVVLAEPRGPVGFIRRAFLGRRRPISELARAVNFANCEPRRDRRVDLCLEEGRRQEAACTRRCGASSRQDSEDGLHAVRCEQACQAARDACARRCRARGTAGAPRR
ncbi:MAG: zinc-ribbon domain-containing protein [Deltaproteobacteria bacterium]|nr:zinc-ribbon domain-containing protein [Deltaproteobacteria bacterium]